MFLLLTSKGGIASKVDQESPAKSSEGRLAKFLRAYQLQETSI